MLRVQPLKKKKAKKNLVIGWNFPCGSTVKDQHFYYSGTGSSCGLGLIPGVGVPTCCGRGQNKQAKKREEASNGCKV